MVTLLDRFQPVSSIHCFFSVWFIFLLWKRRPPRQRNAWENRAEVAETAMRPPPLYNNNPSKREKVTQGHRETERRGRELKTSQYFVSTEKPPKPHGNHEQKPCMARRGLLWSQPLSYWLSGLVGGNGNNPKSQNQQQRKWATLTIHVCVKRTSPFSMTTCGHRGKTHWRDWQLNVPLTPYLLSVIFTRQRQTAIGGKKTVHSVKRAEGEK